MSRTSIRPIPWIVPDVPIHLLIVRGGNVDRWVIALWSISPNDNVHQELLRLHGGETDSELHGFARLRHPKHPLHPLAWSLEWVTQSTLLSSEQLLDLEPAESNEPWLNAETQSAVHYTAISDLTAFFGTQGRRVLSLTTFTIVPPMDSSPEDSDSRCTGE